MRRVGLAVSLAILGMALFSGCGAAKRSDGTPEQVIDQVMEECQAGAYEKVAQRFEGGTKIWARDPQWVRDFIDRICDSGRAKSYEVRDRLERGESVVLVQITTYREPDHKEGIRTMTWHFTRDKARWLITKVQ